MTTASWWSVRESPWPRSLLNRPPGRVAARGSRPVRPGDRDRPTAGRGTPTAHGGGGPRGPGSSRRPTRSAVVSNEIWTTARSSDWSAPGSVSVTSSTSSSIDRRQCAASRLVVAELAGAIDDLRALANVSGRADCRTVSSWPCETWQAGRRSRCGSRRRRGPVGRGGGDGLLRGSRGADQRVQARRRTGTVPSPPIRRTVSLVLTVRDDGVGGASPRPLPPRARGRAPDCGVWRTGWPLSAGVCRSTAGRFRYDADGAVAVRVVIAEDQVLLRAGLCRLFADRGHVVVASPRCCRDAGAASRPRARPRRARRADAADLHRRRGPSRAGR